MASKVSSSSSSELWYLNSLHDRALDRRDVALGVDDVEVEEFLEALEDAVGLLHEHPVALPARLLVQVGRALLEQRPDAGLAHPLVVRDDLASALELALDRLPLLDVEDDDLEHRLREQRRERRLAVLRAQVEHLLVQQLHALDLHPRARKPVDDDAGGVDRLEQALEQEADDVGVADQAAAVLHPPHLGRVEQVARHDRAARRCRARAG